MSVAFAICAAVYNELLTVSSSAQVANRPFRFLRIVRTVRYVRGLRTLASVIVAALPATLQVRVLAEYFVGTQAAW